MSKVQKIIILLFLVCHYTVSSSKPVTAEESLSATSTSDKLADGDYGKWLADSEVTDDMKNNWRNQRDQSYAYYVKTGRLEIISGLKAQKPDGNILVIPFADRILTLRSSIYPLGHIYRAYDSQDLADILLKDKEARLLKTTNFFYNKFAQIAIKIPKLIENIKDKKLKEKQLEKITDTKGKSVLNKKITELQKEIPETINNINKLMNNIKSNLREEIFKKSIEEPLVSKLKDMSLNLDTTDTKKFDKTIVTINKENNDLCNKSIVNLKKYCEQVINYFVFLKDKFGYNTKEDIETLREKIRNANDYRSVNQILQNLEESENTDCALAHTEMMFRYYICKNRLTAPENIYSYLDLCNKCEQMLAKDISTYTKERGFYAVSEIKFNANTNHTTPDSLLKKYRLLPIDSGAVDDSKIEEKSSLI